MSVVSLKKPDKTVVLLSRLLSRFVAYLSRFFECYACAMDIMAAFHPLDRHKP